MPVEVDSPAPLFTLKSMTPDGLVDVSLADNFGKSLTVLFFFPAAFTGVCTQEFCDLTGGLAGLEGLGAKAYGISVDTPHAQAGWAKANGITVPLLSDFSKKTVAAYGLESPDFAGTGGSVSQRAVVVVDRAGIVRYVQVTPALGDMPDMDAVRQAVASLA